MQRKKVSDVIDGMQTNLYRENPLFDKLSETRDDSASTLRSLNCFSLPLNSTCLGGVLQ